MPFDPNQLAPILGGIAPGGHGAFLRGWQRAQQELQQRQQTGHQQQLQQSELQLRQQQEARLATAAQQEAELRRQQTEQQRQMQLIQAVTSFRQMLEDPSIDTPEAFHERMQVATELAPRVGIDPAFLHKTFAPAPDTFTKRQLTKRLESLRSMSEKERLTFEQGGSWEIGGQRYTPAQARAAVYGAVNAQTGAALPIVPSSAPEDLSKSGLDVQAAEALRNGNMVEYARLKKVADEMAGARQNPLQATPILIPTVDEHNNPILLIAPRTPGARFTPAPTASQATSMAEQETGLTLIGDIERLYQPGYVGPAIGRLTRVQMATPGTPDVDPKVAEFYASVASLRNEIIRLISGAAVSGSEEIRLRSQLPDVTDKPAVFSAKLTQTKRNREVLLSRTKARAGQPATVPAGGAPGPNPFRQTRP